MEHATSYDPALIVALALLAGMLAQSIGAHLKIPGIVLLIATGVVLGPDLLAVVRPDVLGGALQVLVGYAVSIILFEGAMNLNMKQLARRARSIRMLVTAGSLVTAIGGTLAARLLLGWGWRLSLLFGTLVIVTGPTVINPLLRRIRIKRQPATVLEAEGVFGDAIGAIVAVVTLELVLSPTLQSWAKGPLYLLERFGLGALAGVAFGWLLALLLRRPGAVPEGYENVFSLAAVLLLFQGTNSLVEESGVVAVTVAGLTVGNLGGTALDELREFKEQLTVLFIGMLFVLLAADVRLAEVRSLGWSGLMVVLVLMLVVRPLNVLIGTWGSDLPARERVFIAWMAPRGIVAAAVSSLFALRLEAAGIAGGADLRALVFLVIATTVVVYGLTGGLVAWMLGVRRRPEGGYVILGANALGRGLGRLLLRHRVPVLFIDSNSHACNAAEAEGFRVIYGSALAESVLLRASLEERDGCVGLTGNEGVNYAFVRRAKNEFRLRRLWIALRPGRHRVTETMVARLGARRLFGTAYEVDHWADRLSGDRATVERWRYVDPPADEELVLHELLPSGRGALPMAYVRGGKLRLVDEEALLRVDDELYVSIAEAKRAEVTQRLEEAGFLLAPDPELEEEPEGPGDKPAVVDEAGR